MLFLSTIERQTKKALASALVLALSCSGWLGNPAFAQGMAAFAPAALQGPVAWASPRGNAHRLLQLAQGRGLTIEDEKLVRAIALRFPEAARTLDTDSLFEQSPAGLRLAQAGKEFVLRLLSSLGDAAQDPASLGISPEAFAELADLRGSISRTPSLDAAEKAVQSSDFGSIFDGSGPSASGAFPVGAEAWAGTAAPSSAMPADLSAPSREPVSHYTGLPAPARLSFPAQKPGLWQRIKAFFRGPALVPAVFVGSIASTYGSEISGASTFIHEGSHRAAAQVLVDPGYLKLQVDGFENLGAFVKNPSWQSLKDFLAMRDTHADGAAGYVSYGDLRPTELGGRIGANASRAVISAAGSAAQAGASMAQFAVGYAVRKDHPVIGYTLMAASSVQHLSNSLYLWSAAGMSAGELAEAASTGHDWASFAAATGVNPTLTALAYTALLPAEALVLHLIGKAVQKKKDDQRALASLISRGEITEADLLRLYDGYPEKARLQAAEASVAALASGQGSPADDPTAADEAAKQYRAFQLHVAQAYQGLVDEEKLRLGPVQEEKLSLKERLAAGWKGLFSGPDKTGNLLQAGMLGGGVAAGAAALAKTLGSALGGEILKGLVPGLGVLGAAYGLHKIGKALRDRSSDGVVKTLDVLQNALSVAGAAGMATLNPLLAAGGHGASLAVLIAKLIYLKYPPA